MTSGYHSPVLLHECIDGLNIKPDGVYVDVTFGGGGHSKAILEKLGPEGRLFAFDQDADAAANEIQDPRFTLVRQNFRFVKNMLGMYGVQQVDGVLADLGVSSHQFDAAERGFSTRFDAKLDMRMNAAAPLDAEQVVNGYSIEDLTRIFKDYGELKRAYYIAREIETKRLEKKIRTVESLKAVTEKFAERGKEASFFARLFQAIRIEVNAEIEVLHEMLLGVTDLLKSDARFVVISYHSLEDRPVKNLFKRGNFEGEMKQDFFGNIERVYKEVNRKVIIPTDEEIAENPRARSAKLRVASKI